MESMKTLSQAIANRQHQVRSDHIVRISCFATFFVCLSKKAIQFHLILTGASRFKQNKESLPNFVLRSSV